MKLSYIPDSLGYMNFEEMLDLVQSLGVQALEIPTGNWSKASHLNLDELIISKIARDKYMDALKKRDIELIALNCSGNPLAYDLLWSKEFFSVCRMVGYDDYVSLEMEDMTMTPLEGVKTSINA
jgi:sugar phosphate isomerase/epimerase